MPTVSVIIVNYNAGDRLQRCLEHLAQQTFQDFDVIVIDNASDDASIDLAKTVSLPAPIHGVTFIDAGANLGFAAGNNRAAEGAKGDWLAFLNPDAYPASDWLEKLIAATDLYPSVDAFGSTQLDDADPTIIDGAGDVFHVFGVPYRGHYGWPAETLPPTGECFAPCAAAALYRKSTFDALGGFDESFFCYGEDVDLGFRLRLASGRAVQVADAIVRHEGSGVTGRYSDFTVYHGNRNRIWTTYKNMPGLLYWPLTPFQLAVNLYLLARAFTVGIAPAYWRALKDGYVGLPKLSQKRRAIQRGRRVALRDLAGALTWAPWKVSRRQASLRPITQHEEIIPQNTHAKDAASNEAAPLS